MPGELSSLPTQLSSSSDLRSLLGPQGICAKYLDSGYTEKLAVGLVGDGQLEEVYDLLEKVIS